MSNSVLARHHKTRLYLKADSRLACTTPWHPPPFPIPLIVEIPSFTSVSKQRVELKVLYNVIYRISNISWDSSVSIVTRLRAEWPRDKRWFSSSKRPNQRRVHSVCCQTDTGEGQNHHLVPRSQAPRAQWRRKPEFFPPPYPPPQKKKLLAKLLPDLTTEIQTTAFC